MRETCENALLFAKLVPTVICFLTVFMRDAKEYRVEKNVAGGEEERIRGRA